MVENSNQNTPRTAKQIVTWATLNGVTVLPGQPKTKKPMGFLARGAVETPEGADPERDTYHVPTPQRLFAIENYWNRLPNDFRETELSISFDTDYPCGDNVFIASLDLDRDDYYDRFINHHLIANWPVVKANRGCKAFVKVNYGDLAEKPKSFAYVGPADTGTVLEILTSKKLAFIYGEHPLSTPENRITYQFVRGFDLTVPTILEVSYEEFQQIYETIANEFDLTRNEDIIRPTANVSPLEYLRRAQNRSRPRDHTRQSLTDLLGLRIEDIGWPNGQISYAGEEIIGSHPVHGSGGGQNYHINPSKNVWRCYSTPCGGGEGTGGDPLMFLAMRYGIIQCSDCHAGVLDDPHLMRDLISRMRADGYEIPERERTPVAPLDMPSCVTDITVAPGDRSDLPSIEELADGPPYIHLSASPRKGKTHRLVEYLMYGVTTGTYCTHTHATCGQAFRIASSMASDLQVRGLYRSVVWMAGKSWCCINKTVKSGVSSCRNCPLMPGDEHITFAEYQRIAKELIDTRMVLSPEVIKDIIEEKEIKKEYCPYYLLKLAEEYADIVITVPHFLTTSDKDAQVKPRNTLVIDEDSTIGSFYPGSIELASMINMASKVSFDNEMDLIKKRVDSIKKSAIVDDCGIEKKRHSVQDMVIIEVSKIVDQIHDILNRVMVDQTRYDINRIFDDVDLSIKIKDVEIGRETKLKTIAKVEQYERESRGKINDDTSVSQLFETFLFPNPYKPFYWQGGAKKKLYLVGDEETLIRPIGLNPETEQIIAIGFTKSEKFISDMQLLKPGNSIKYDIKKFEYGKNFILVKVGANTKESSDSRKFAKKRFNKILSYAKDTNSTSPTSAVSPIVLTSSKMRQGMIVDRNDGHFRPLKKEGIDYIERYLHDGGFNVVVSNSTFTRGIDVDMYDVIFSESTDYSLPYCDAMISHAMEINDIPLLERILQLRYSYVVDEITNCVLRVSPIRTRDQNQVKIIIIPDYDAAKIHPKVLEDMHVVEFNYEESENKIESLWNIVTMCARKVNVKNKEDLEIIPGLEWEDARVEFNHFIANGPEEGQLIASVRREREKKIDMLCTSYVRPSQKSSKTSIIKHVRDKSKIPGLKSSEIEKRLRYLCNISKLASWADPNKNEIYYRKLEYEVPASVSYLKS